MKIISFYNRKNGVGKTTLSYNLARQLGFDFIEAKDEYFNKHKKGIENSVYDININNKKTSSPILEKSNYIVIPTELDFKVLIDTKVSINYIKKINPNAKIVVVFNRLHTHYKKSELPYTSIARDFLEHTGKYVYIRDNKLWYKDFIEDKFYLDSIIHKSNYEYFLKLDLDDLMLSYFSNNNILEILYQFSYYYSPLYSVKKNFKNKEEYIKLFKNTQSKVVNSKKQLCDDTVKKSNQMNLICILEEFEKIKTMTSNNEKLIDIVFNTHIVSDCYSKNITTPVNVPFDFEAYKKNIREVRKRLKLSNNKDPFKLLDLKDSDELNPNLINDYEAREGMIYTFLRCIFNMKVAKDNRKILRDMRNLLISVGEYEWKV